ncbi:endonuclease domain-containing 1 protein-like [Megalobrama amblycephala]|uniref:endonuclease domain-containing 1 protein-like n=1 Tax=Megalobrama amblycephala TaxID=75352 RepID=UPI0020144B2D|nr:endonuclease domain-containing 1 protein-like [Megalobrama amblycephala]
MFLVCLLICVVLRAFSAQAKVVETFAECKEFFYDDKEPVGMDQNAKKICQKLVKGGFYYATLYSVHHRIPLYSAYTLGADCKNEKENIWRIEPQVCASLSNKRLSLAILALHYIRSSAISDTNIDYMVPENDPTIDKNIIKVNQSMSSDYKENNVNNDIKYDRGHLNPNCFQYKEGRKATFTLTNAAPMVPRFNRVHWCKWETTLKRFLKQLNIDGKAYIVTGTVPSANVRIPKDSKRVTVPSHVWTAVCYYHSNDDTKSFSFGYIGQNHPIDNIKLMSVSALNVQVSQLYTTLMQTAQSVRIFHNDCFEDHYNNFKETLNNAFHKSRKRERDSEYEEFRKRYASEQSDVESLLVPEKQKPAADGCLDDTECCDSCQSDEGDEPYKYGEKKVCGYTDNNNKNRHECCTSDDCFSAVNEKTCKPEHPCGYYGEKYLWCYTTDSSWYDSWDYCCTDCSQ